MYKAHGNGFGEPRQSNHQEDDWDNEQGTHAESYGVKSGGQKRGFGHEQPASRGFGSSDNGREDDGESYVIEVPSQDIKRIIGRGGTKIRELEQNSGCKIKINKERDDGVNAGIELVGSKEEQEAAEQLITDIVASSQSGGFGGGSRSGRGQGFGGSRGGSRGGFGGSDYGGEDTLEVEIPSRDIARVIGRGGSKIRELQEDSGTRIHINKDKDNGVTAVVEIRGSEEGQQRAKQLIEELTAGQSFYGSGGDSSYSRGRSDGGSRRGGFGGGGGSGRSDWGGDSLEMEVASKDVSRIIGKGGSKIQEMQEKSGTRIKINKDRDNGVTTVVEIRGSEEGQQLAKQLIEDLTASQSSYGSGGDSYSRGGRGEREGGFGGGRGGGFGGGRSDWGGDSLEIEVASSDVSRIIGKGGSRIQEMQDKSGTRIKINKDRDDGVTTIVEIRGSEEGQQLAKELIEELTASQDSYGSRNGDMV